MKYKVWPEFKHNSLRKLCSKVKWKPNNVLSGRFISYNINNKSHYHHSIKQTSHKNIKKYQLGISWPNTKLSELTSWELYGRQ